MIFDCVYDDNKIIDCVDKSGNDFVIRREDIKRKGKIKMKLWFDDNDKYEIYVSHTKVVLSYKKRISISICIWTK